jgi:hypothetical protein
MVYYIKTKEKQTQNESKAMTLTTKDNGLYDCYTLRDDIKGAIKSNDYTTLQATLKDFRAIHYYEGSLKTSKKAMLEAAQAIQADLEAECSDADAQELNRTAALKAATDKTEDQILFHQIYLKSAPVSDTAKLWADNHESGEIVLIHECNQPGANGYYVTYGSHARFLGRAIGRDPVVENGVSKLSIPHCFMWHDQIRMRNEYKVELVLIDPREAIAA